MNVFNPIAAVCGAQAGTAAETVANIELFVNASDTSSTLSLNAPLVIERFGTTPLFRIVALTGTVPFRNTMSLCLPTDLAWQVSQLRKIKGANSGKKAIQFQVLSPVGNKEGFDKLVITIPFDGHNGNAMLYYEAVLFASQEVSRHVLGA